MVSVRAAQKRAKSQADELVEALKQQDRPSRDSFQNFGLNLGMGTDNALSDSTYGFNPITRQRTLLEWIHRGSWLGGVAVDLVADDMTRAGIEFGSDLPPKDGEEMAAGATEMGIWEQINDAVRWGRLYGGSIAVMLIVGQRMDTPLRLETIGRDQFRGLYVLDRWQVEPSLNNLVTDFGPDLGQPKFYTVNSDGPALRSEKIHYTRCIRLEGTRLPWNQRIGENGWGLSVYERLYDRMVAFDSATQGAAQLVYKSALRTYKIFQMRELIGGDAQAQQMLAKYVEMMRRFQSIEGITLIDAKDDFVMNSAASFPGIADALVQFGQQISGALQIPLVRLFGQSPAGLNSSGESDLTTYYDGIKHQQERWLGVPVTRVYRAIAASRGIALKRQFSVQFRALWQLNDEKKGALAGAIATAVSSVETAGIVSRATALKELKQSSRITGLWSNITDDEIAEAESEPAPMPEGMVRGEDGQPVPAGSEGDPAAASAANEAEAGRQFQAEQQAAGQEHQAAMTEQQQAAAERQQAEAAAQQPGQAEQHGEPSAPSGMPAQPAKDAGPPKKHIHVHLADDSVGSGNLFKEDEHPREDDGKFTFKHGAPGESKIKLKPIKQGAQRQFHGKPVPVNNPLPKLATGDYGEAMFMQIVAKMTGKPAMVFDTTRNNAPVDIISGDMMVECKCGAISNGTTAHHWRVTNGQTGKAEQAWLNTAPKHEKAAWNNAKLDDAMNRKYAALAYMSKLTGQKMRAVTMTGILNADTRTVDVFLWDGYHKSIRWNDPDLEKAYIGSYQYEEEQ